MKYCPQALTMIATLKRTPRGTRKDWASTGQGTAIHKHLGQCLKCGRDLGDKPWPPVPEQTPTERNEQ